MRLRSGIRRPTAPDQPRSARAQAGRWSRPRAALASHGDLRIGGAGPVGHHGRPHLLHGSPVHPERARDGHPAPGLRERVVGPIVADRSPATSTQLLASLDTVPGSLSGARAHAASGTPRPSRWAQNAIPLRSADSGAFGHPGHPALRPRRTPRRWWWACPSPAWALRLFRSVLPRRTEPGHCGSWPWPWPAPPCSPRRPGPSSVGGPAAAPCVRSTRSRGSRDHCRWAPAYPSGGRRRP